MEIDGTYEHGNSDTSPATPSGIEHAPPEQEQPSDPTTQETETPDEDINHDAIGRVLGILTGGSIYEDPDED